MCAFLQDDFFIKKRVKNHSQVNNLIFVKQNIEYCLTIDLQIDILYSNRKEDIWDKQW